MKSFIVGGTGFIGRALVKELVSRFGADNVVCLTLPQNNDLEISGRAELAKLKVRTIPGDIRTWQPTQNEIPRFDVLFHLAASTDSGAADHTTNDLGTEHLLNVLGDHLGGKRVVYVSTTAAMDRSGKADTPLTEQSDCFPKTEYGKTKLRAEQIVKENQSRLGFTFSILRLSTVYGYGTRKKGLFDVFEKWVRNGNPLGRIKWPGRTGLISREDVVRILVEFAEMHETENETICLVTESLPIGDIPRLMANNLNIPLSQIELPIVFWQLIRVCLQTPGLYSIGPERLRNQFWRLSLIADHGLWCESTKMEALYTTELTYLKEGIRDVLGLNSKENDSVMCR
ncbi:MAG: NAD(P)-dependent oxidoreductase [Deltaproteobacteria bacterium]|nr:NAD(P)-dependent oxidoreductase [Deltaproteobacteria bacterium]